MTQDVAGYAARAAAQVPGLHDMHRMAAILLAERVPATGRLLVLGAGGGMELAALADAQPGWHLEGVDPDAAMLDQARLTLGDRAQRVTLHHGYIDSAPDGPFDGATCLLTLHFLPAPERLATLKALAARLHPGAPLVVAHHSAPPPPERGLWLRRIADWQIAGGTPPERAYGGIAAMNDRLPMLSPHEDTALLAEAGFADIQLFYAALTFKGWVCTRA